MEWKTILTILVSMVVLVILLIAFVPGFWTSAKTFMNIENVTFGLSSYPKETGKEVKFNTLFFDSFKSDVEKCFKSDDSDCYCPLSVNAVSDGLVIKLTNLKGNAIISLIKNSKISSCSLSSPGEIIDSNTLRFALMFENEYGTPSTNDLGNYKTLKLDEFTTSNDLFFYGKEVCSKKDVKGRNSIDFTNGILYKFKDNQIALTRSQQGLKQCTFKTESPIIPS